ncbi:MAG: hypothetical protein GX763_05505 [Clostridiaceae bacterium]|nr:hypothetical protein [Clostridiaceae bacterium]
MARPQEATIQTLCDLNELRVFALGESFNNNFHSRLHRIVPGTKLALALLYRKNARRELATI